MTASKCLGCRQGVGRNPTSSTRARIARKGKLLQTLHPAYTPSSACNGMVRVQSRSGSTVCSVLHPVWKASATPRTNGLRYRVIVSNQREVLKANRDDPIALRVAQGSFGKLSQNINTTRFLNADTGIVASAPLSIFNCQLRCGYHQYWVQNGTRHRNIPQIYPPLIMHEVKPSGEQRPHTVQGVEGISATPAATSGARPPPDLPRSRRAMHLTQAIATRHAVGSWVLLPLPRVRGGCTP